MSAFFSIRKLLYSFCCVVFITNISNAQKSSNDIDVFEAMQRNDFTLEQIEEIAQKYFTKVGTGRGTGYKQYQRWLYEKKFHLNENGTFITPNQEWNAYQKVERQLKPKNSAERAVNPWTELGPYHWSYTSSWNPGVGRLTSVAIHPSNESIIYVSSPGGGIWKSINAGSTWTPLIDAVNSSWMDVFNLCIDNQNVNTIYAGLSSGGVLKSTNAGSTWAATGSGPSTIRKIAVHPSNSSIVFAVASNGIWRSTNGATSWTQVSTTSTQDIEFKPNDANVMYASTSSNTILRSTNNGTSWSTITLTGSGRALIGVSPANPDVVYVVQASGSLFGYFYKSIDAGLTYSITITGSPTSGTNFFGYNTDGTGTTGQATYDMAICVNPTNVDEVHIAGIICWKSTNGGTSFVAETAWSYPNSTGYNHADVHGLEWVNSTIYSVSDGGLYKSVNNGDDWIDLSNGLAIRQFYRIACAKTDANIITGGAQDNGTTFRKSSGNWVDWLGADGMDAIISPTNANIAIGTSQNGSIYKTTNGGASYSGLTKPANGAWVTPLVMHPTNHDTVFGGWTGVYKSVNGGSSWTLISGTTITSTMSCLAVASSNTKYIYGSVGSTLYRTADGGTTWTAAAAPSTITSICVSPLNPQKIWLTTSATTNNVMVSTNMGTTFTYINTGLPAVAARSIVVDNSTYEGLYVGMNIGVYYRNNINTSWVQHATNLPLVAVNEVELQLSSRKVRVATYGRGVWESDMQPEPSPPSCTTISTPINGTTNTNTTLLVSWQAVSGVLGYYIKVGTTSGGGEILNNLNVGNVTSYTLSNLSESTQYYVVITPYNIVGSATNCSINTFKTGAKPSCISNFLPNNTALSSISPTLSWTAATNNPLGYKLSVGTTSGGTQLLNNLSIGNVTSYQLNNLPYSTTIYVRVTPYNAIGNAVNCIEYSFITVPDVPTCASIAVPINNTNNISINNVMRWYPSTDADGYYLSVGTSSGGTNVLNKLDVGVDTAYVFSNLQFNTTYYAKVIPYNTTGEAVNCTEIAFTTENSFVLLSPKIFLSNVDISSNLMSNYYRTTNFPFSDPYNVAPLNTYFNHVNNTTQGSISPNALMQTGANTIVDWVFLELRSGILNNTTTIATKSALLQSDGDVVHTDGISPVRFDNVLANNYFLAVRHRNHIGILTSDAFSLSSSNTVINLTDSSVNLTGFDNYIQKSATVRTLVPGDVNADGEINTLDYLEWKTQNGQYNNYTLSADLNQDGVVNLVDFAIWELHNGKFQQIK